MEELPLSLKMELSMVINRQMYTSVEFFQEKDRTFLTWIAVVLRPMKCEFKEYIYKESELAQESIFMVNLHLVFFISKGQVGFVIPRFVTKIYRVIA